MSLTQLLTNIDDFCQWFTPEWEKISLKIEIKKGIVLRTLSRKNHRLIFEEMIYYLFWISSSRTQIR
jgi:exoribonuclease II